MSAAHRGVLNRRRRTRVHFHVTVEAALTFAAHAENTPCFPVQYKQAFEEWGYQKIFLVEVIFNNLLVFRAVFVVRVMRGAFKPS